MHHHKVKQRSADKGKSIQKDNSNPLNSDKFDAAGIAQMQRIIGNKAALSMLQAKLSSRSPSAQGNSSIIQRKILKSVPQWIQEQYKEDDQFGGLDGNVLQQYLGMSDGGISDAGSFNDDYESMINNPVSSNMKHKMESVRAEIDPIIYSGPEKASKLIKRLVFLSLMVHRKD
jgi:hypothetical protein